MRPKPVPPEKIERWLVWDRPQMLGTIVELIARNLYDEAGYEVFHKTKIGAGVMPEKMGRTIHHYIKVTFEEVEP